jgi:Regulator of G protein signaling domain
MREVGLLAQALYRKYLVSGSDYELNIDHESRVSIQTRMQNKQFAPDMFDTYVVLWCVCLFVCLFVCFFAFCFFAHIHCVVCSFSLLFSLSLAVCI